MRNRLDELFDRKKDILNIYFTAGYPEKHSTIPVLKALQANDADVIEIGMPYSDPIADGPVIQNSNAAAIRNGMDMHLVFEQLNAVKGEIHVPIILMGYLNPVIQYGMEAFCRDASSAGVSGVILPDLPMYEYEKYYQKIFKKYKLHFIFLISPATSAERIHKADKLSGGFLYAVSASSTTGENTSDLAKEDWYNRIKQMKLKNKILIGFGINDNKSFEHACQFASGAVIGTAFIKAIKSPDDLENKVSRFVKSIKDVNNP